MTATGKTIYLPAVVALLVVVIGVGAAVSAIIVGVIDLVVVVTVVVVNDEFVIRVDNVSSVAVIVKTN